MWQACVRLSLRVAAPANVARQTEAIPLVFFGPASLEVANIAPPRATASNSARGRARHVPTFTRALDRSYRQERL